MKPTKLTLEERAVIHNPINIPYFEIIKGMNLKELRSFDIYKPNDLQHYLNRQKDWLNEEKHLIGHRLGHNRKVNDTELLNDFEHYHNGERFRVFYVFKFPDKVTYQE